MTQKAIRTLLPDGRVAINNIIDEHTGETVQYVKVDNPVDIIPDGDKYIQVDSPDFGSELFRRVGIKPALPNDTVYHVNKITHTDWKTYCRITFPERDSTDISEELFYDYITLKGSFYTYYPNDAGFPTRGFDQMDKVNFQIKGIGWREYNYVGRFDIYTPKNYPNDTIRVVKVSRFVYEVQYKYVSTFTNLDVEVNYTWASNNGILIEFGADLSTSTGEVIADYTTIKKESKKRLDYELIDNAPNEATTAPLIKDRWGNIEIKPIGKNIDVTPYPRNNIRMETLFPPGAGPFYGFATWQSQGTGSVSYEPTDGKDAIKVINTRGLPPNPYRVELSEYNASDPATLTPPMSDPANRLFRFGVPIRPTKFHDDKGGYFLCFQTLPLDPSKANRPSCFSMEIEDGRWKIRIATNKNDTVSYYIPTTIATYYDLGPVAWNTFTCWDVEINYQWDETGYINIWKNGELAFTYTGPTTFNDPNGYRPYFKFGIYKPQWNGFTPTPESPDSIEVYFGKIRLGNPGATMEDVACDKIYYKNTVPLEVNISSDRIIHTLNPLQASQSSDLNPLSEVVGRRILNGELGVIAPQEGAKYLLQRGVLADGQDLDAQINIGSWILLSTNTYPGAPISGANAVMTVYRGGAGGIIQEIAYTTLNRFFRRVRTGSYTPFIELSGAPFYLTNNDNDFTIPVGNYFVGLTQITADRVLTLPSASSSEGKLIYIKNNNTSSFSYTFNVPVTRLLNSITVVPNNCIIELRAFGILWYITNSFSEDTILTSPNGSKYRLDVDDSGNLSTVMI